MKKGVMITGAFAAVVVAGSLLFGQFANASVSTEQAAQQTVEKYFEAMKAGNANEAVTYVHDTRFADHDATLDAYKEMLQADPITDYKILSTEVHGNKATVSVEVTTPTIGTQQLDLNVEEEQDGLKIFVQNVKKIKGKIK